VSIRRGRKNVKECPAFFREKKSQQKKKRDLSFFLHFSGEKKNHLQPCSRKKRKRGIAPVNLGGEGEL